MHIEAQKTTVFVIHLTLGEALAALSDPAPLQKELRGMLPAGDVARPARKTRKSKAKAAKSGACDYCGKKFLARGLKRHMKSCPQRPDA